MPQVATLARLAWQLMQQGHAVIEDIANVMGKPVSAIERWIVVWPEIADQMLPWHQGQSSRTVPCLKQGGIISREALIEAWENGSIQCGQLAGIGVTWLTELRHWLETRGIEVPEAPLRPMIIDLSTEAEAALNHLWRMSGESAF